MSLTAVLPHELWNNVAVHCRRRDLGSLARVNKTALHATRPVLFQKLVLEQRVIQKDSALLDLLKSDKSLCAAVKSVKLVTQWSTRESWITVDLLRDFVHAESISLEGWTFKDDEKADKAFCDLMCSGQWRSFEYRPALQIIPNFDAMGWGAITGLQRVSLNSPSILTGAVLFLRASASTITHLTMPSGMSDYNAAELGHLLGDDVQFPNLQFFECGGYMIGEDMTLPWDLMGRVNRFLFRHPSIQHLRVPCDDGCCVVRSHCTLDSGLLGPDFLPRLKKLDAHIDAVQVMTMHGVSSMKTVEEVITGDWSYFGPSPYEDQTEVDIDELDYAVTEGNQSMDNFLSTLLHHGGLPGVKRFTMTVGPKHSAVDYSRLTVGQMETMAKVLPFVEDWTGNGNGFYDATEQDLINMFKSFRTLKVIRFRGMDVDKAIMRAIARAVPTLQSFYYEDATDRRDDEWLTFEVIRLTNHRILFSKGTAVDSN